MSKGPELISTLVKFLQQLYICMMCINPYNAQAYFLYELILPSSNLMVLNHTICHCQHWFNGVNLY